MLFRSLFEFNFPNGYDEYGRSLGSERRTTPNAAGSMQTTLRDYATFLSALMRGELSSSEPTDPNSFRAPVPLAQH